MAKRKATRDELKQMILSELLRRDPLDGDCRDCDIDIQVYGEPDENGAWWGLGDWARNCPGECIAVANRIVLDLQSKYDPVDNE